jgi:tyrosyl-tRNA synthetase
VLLKESQDCILQIGGSDQWANIVAGVELGRKLEFHDGHEVGNIFGFTCPLLVKADGEKMGKTEKGTLWVSRDKTDSYDFYQSFINIFDEDVERLLSFFTRIDVEEIKEMCKNDIVGAKKLMAFEVTKLVHGEEEAIKVKKTSDEIFSGAGVSKDMPNFKIVSFKDVLITDLLVKIGIVSSKSEARRLIDGNGISVNQEKISSSDLLITKNYFVNNELIIQKGKKVFLKVII